MGARLVRGKIRVAVWRERVDSGGDWRCVVRFCGALRRERVLTARKTGLAFNPRVAELGALRV